MCLCDMNVCLWLKFRDKVLTLAVLCAFFELGVQDVITDQYNQKVIVTGNADPALVLSYVKKAKKRSQFWDENVNYSQNYQNYIDLLDEDKKRADLARAQAVEAEEAAIAVAYLQSQMNIGVQNIIVHLPKEENGPNVIAILPAPNAPV